MHKIWQKLYTFTDFFGSRMNFARQFLSQNGQEKSIEWSEKVFLNMWHLNELHLLLKITGCDWNLKNSTYQFYKEQFITEFEPKMSLKHVVSRRVLPSEMLWQQKISQVL